MLVLLIGIVVLVKDIVVVAVVDVQIEIVIILKEKVFIIVRSEINNYVLLVDDLYKETIKLVHENLVHEQIGVLYFDSVVSSCY